jgi:tetratricopeptide (TPR) repeat protein
MEKAAVQHRFLPWVAAVAVALAAAAAPAPASGAFKYLKPGMEAADFTLRLLDDRELTLAELKQSPATLLVFWATWSPHSEAALRFGQALAGEHGAKGLRVVAVNLNRQEIGLQERSLIDKTVASLGLTVPVALDPGFAVSSAFGIVAYPSCALLDAKGVLVFDAAGWSKGTAESTRERVEILLGLRPPPAAAAASAGRAPERKALLYYNLGRSLLRQGERSKGIDALESAAAADAAWAAPRVLLGHQLLQEGKEASVGKAEEHFRAAVALEPENVSAVCGLGEVMLRRGRVEEAAGLFEKAVALDATFTPALTNRGVALARLGRSAEALALFAAAQALNPRDAGTWAGQAETRELAGELREAAADYRQAVEILLGKD